MTEWKCEHEAPKKTELKMAQPAKQTDKEVTFTGVHVQNSTRIVVLGVVDEFAEENKDHAMIFYRIRDKWYHQLVDDSVGDVCTIEEPKTVTLAMGVNGTIYAASSAGTVTEQVDTTAEGPSYSALLRAIRKIGNHIYVAGMARMVYRRNSPGQWNRIDQGVFAQRGERTSAIGFNDIDGLKESEIYAAGYKGEIWHYDGRKWEQQDSPTNVALTGVQCIPNGDVYICGMAGTLIHGSRGRWAAIPQKATSKDFWGITWFKSKIYVANYDGVFALNGNDLDRVEMGLKTPVTTAYLDATDDLMWSVGEKDLVYTSNGTQWTISDKP